jgi:hypothetical protein
VMGREPVLVGHDPSVRRAIPHTSGMYGRPTRRPA